MTFILATTITPDPSTGLALAKTLDRHLDLAIIREDPAGLDALEFASWLGPVTSRLGIVPEVTVTHLEPFHIATASATLDYSARARAGLAIGVTTDPVDAALVGRRDAAAPAATWDEAAQIIGVIRGLWDSWDEDAIIRDTATDRYIDRDRLHRLAAEVTDSTGQDYSVLGPSITPRPPQGHPPIVVRAGASNRAAVLSADIVLAEAADLAAVRTRVPADVPVLVIVPAPTSSAEVADLVDLAGRVAAGGASGLLLEADAESQLETGVRLVSELVPALAAAGLRDAGTDAVVDGANTRMAGETLRDGLGLPAAVSVFAHV